MTIPDDLLFSFKYEGSPTITPSPFKPDFDLAYLLPKSFLADDFWNDLLVSTATVLDDQVHTPLSNLVHIRVPEAQDRIYKALHAGMMGYNIKDSVMTDAAYDRLNNNVGEYLYEQGKDNFICFLGYVLGIKLSLVRLWTQDYVNFFPSHGGASSIFEGGTWYPTTHVGVVYDTNDAVSTTLPVTTQDLTELFYKHAPIDLVLAWLSANTTIMMGTIYIQVMTAITSSVRFYVNARGDLNVNLGVNTFGISACEVLSHVICPYSQSKFEFFFFMATVLKSTTNVSSSLLLWNDTQDAIADDRFSVRRPSNNSWCFTGIGAGTWQAANSARYNVDPVTGAKLGVLLEDTSINYLRSSLHIGAKPWVITGSPVPVVLPDAAMDGGALAVWRATTDNDSLVETIKLGAGVYTAQLVYRTESGGSYVNSDGFLPRIDIVSNGVLEVSSLGDRMTYPVIDSYSLANSESLGGGWMLLKVTFTLSVDSDIRMVIPLTGALGLFYAGVETGPFNTSFIYTDDCRVGVREAESAYINTAEAAQGAFAFAISYNTFTNSGPQYPAASATEASLLDLEGNSVLEITVNTSSTQLIANLISNRMTLVSEGANSNPSIMASSLDNTPNIITSWGIKNSFISVNGLPWDYDGTNTSIALTRIGPGWYGYLTSLLVSPVASDSATLQTVTQFR
jgi:hypothetical protein